VIGGLLLATVSTLFFVPVVFAGVHQRLARRAESDAIWRAGPHIRSLEPCRMTVIPNSASTLSARASRNSASR
jgi:hypothetical protein